MNPKPTDAPTAEVRLRCRHLQPSGHKCPSPALSGHPHCYIHGSDRRRLRNVKVVPAVIDIPLLDNHIAIQAVCTDIARALVAGTLDINTARQILSALSIAARTLPRPISASRSKSKQDKPEAPEPVAEIVRTPEGEELAPETPYDASAGKKEREWSFAEYLYRKTYPERANEPLPEEGYVDPEKGSSIPDQPALGQPYPLEAILPKPKENHQAEAAGIAQEEGNSQGVKEPNQNPEPGILPDLQAMATGDEQAAPRLRFHAQQNHPGQHCRHLQNLQ